MDKNVAVVGCGSWGQNLIRNFVELGALHTLCDTDTDRLKRLETMYPELGAEQIEEAAGQLKEFPSRWASACE